MRRLVVCLAVGVGLIGWLATATADAAKPARRPKPAKPAAVAPVKTGLFEAMTAKQVTATFVPRDAAAARVALVNVSDTPLEVSLPSAFAGAPLAALPNLQPEAAYIPASSESSVPQILGSVIFTSPGQSAAPSASLALVLQPKQMRQFAVPCVCLQYGNPTPRPEVPYKLVSLDSVSRSPQLQELLDEFSLGRTDQPVVQLAAWYFSNNLNWDQIVETGFATDRVPEAQSLVRLIDAHVSRKRNKGGPQTGGQTTSPGSQLQQPNP